MLFFDLREFELLESNLVNRIIKISHIHNLQAYSGNLTCCEIVRVNASLGELRRDKEKLSLPITCEFVRVKVS